jgi:translation initiation factor 2 alpha subunit (eIF-2alpha)
MKEGDLILCKVEKIESTTVFVKMPDEKIGTIIISEIAPGRIKNIREYVSPNKKIVCKVLRIKGEHIDLSLRRVSSKEKKEILEKDKQEQTIKAALNQIFKKDSEKIQKKILADFDSLYGFIIKAKQDDKLISKYIPKKAHEAVKKIIEKKQKQVEVKKIIKLKCLEDDGIKRIKKILSIENQKTKVNYLSAGKFQITIKEEDYKKANQKSKNLLAGIQKSSKQNSCEFETKK